MIALDCCEIEQLKSIGMKTTTDPEDYILKYNRNIIEIYSPSIYSFNPRYKFLFCLLTTTDIAFFKKTPGLERHPDVI